MYMGLVFPTYISCHKTGTGFVTCAILFLCLSPLPNRASSRIWELDCRWRLCIARRARWLLDTENVSDRVVVCGADSYYIDRPESQNCIRFMLMWYPLTAKSSRFPVRINEIRSRLVDGRVWLSLNQSIPVIMSNDRMVSCFRQCRQGGYC